MKTSEVQGCGGESDYYLHFMNPEHESLEQQFSKLQPAAPDNLWVVKPVPITENLKKMEEPPRRGSTRNVKFWLAARTRKFMKQRARVHARDLRNDVKNNSMYQKESAVTFHRAMKLMMVMGQIFAINPVLGIMGKDVYKLRFKFFSWRHLYSMVSLLGQAVMTYMCVYLCFKETFDFSSGTTVVFYGSNCLTTAIFLGVARRWPELSRHIARTEVVDPCLDRKLVARCNLTVLLVSCASLVEHVLSMIAGIGVALDCSPDKPLLEAYNRQAFPWVFNYVTYSNFLGGIAAFINLQLTINWNFTDLFAICFSHYLTCRFEQVNRRLTAARGKYMPTWFWRRAREDYCRLTQLVRRIDSVISGIIFVSFANNLYFICLQLFHTLEDGIKGAIPRCQNRTMSGPFRGYEHAVYFVYSFIFLMARSLAVSLLVARVHTAARAPAPALYDVPSPVYCVEVQRFVDQVNSDNVALSGLQFFNVTRGLVLTIAGTIVTYELVLVQFNASPPSTLSPRTTPQPVDFT